jgi:hypothetical protein
MERRCRDRVANIWDFPPKNANLGIFWPLGNWGIFRGILKVSYNRAFFDQNLEFLGDFFSLSWQPCVVIIGEK